MVSTIMQTKLYANSVLPLCSPVGPHLLSMIWRHLTPVVEDTDKERIAADEKLAKNLGLIRVCVYRATFKKEGHKKFSHGDLKIGIDGISLAEKALKGKALSHGTA